MDFPDKLQRWEAWQLGRVSLIWFVSLFRMLMTISQLIAGPIIPSRWNFVILHSCLTVILCFLTVMVNLTALRSHCWIQLKCKNIFMCLYNKKYIYFFTPRQSLINVSLHQHKEGLTAGGQESVWICCCNVFELTLKLLSHHSEYSSALTLKLMGIFQCLKYSSLLTPVSVKPRRPLSALSLSPDALINFRLALNESPSSWPRFSKLD